MNNERYFREMNAKLRHACSTGNVRQVHQFLGKRPSSETIAALIDEYGCSPLHYACSYGHVDVVSMLLVYHYWDVNLTNKVRTIPRLHQLIFFREWSNSIAFCM